MKKLKLKFLFLQIIFILFFSFNFISSKAFSQVANVTNSLTVNSTLVISDASTEASNPTLNVNLNLTPTLGAAAASGSANVRLRTNQSMWTLTVQKSTLNAGTTNISDSDITLLLSTSAGSTANASAGTRAFASNTLNNISTTTIVSGSAKTSSLRDSSNSNNYFQVNTSYSVYQDFFFTPGTASVSLSYIFSSI